MPKGSQAEDEIDAKTNRKEGGRNHEQIRLPTNKVAYKTDNKFLNAKHYTGVHKKRLRDIW